MLDEKIIIGLVATAVWVSAIVGKHFWPDLDATAITYAAGSALSGLGIYHITTKDDVPDVSPPADPVPPLVTTK
jgi:hypothetical protein